ncbi:MAG: enoyl-ACP reductase, partial [Nitrospinota bacterium]
AWAIAQALHAAGVTLIFTYQGERLRAGVEELAGSLGSELVLPCDVTNEEEVAAVVRAIDERHGHLHGLVHSIAFAKREELSGSYLDTSAEGWRIAQDVSAYSLVTLCRHAASLLSVEGGSVVALTYLGSERVVPRYNVMGIAKASLEASIRYLAYDLGPQKIRVNGVSAGPIKTLASRVIAGFSDMLAHVEARSPLRRNVDASEVATATAFLLSDLASGVTGEILYVDAGYHVMGM